jgi:peptide/nickel transport system ATP-binding protein
MAEPVLSIRDLCVDYVTDRGPVRAVDHVSLDVHQGEILGIAGESGSGKSTLAQALLRILPPPAVVSCGRVLFEGRDILAFGEPQLRELRWKRISMVFQSAMDALNPVLTVGEQIVDTLLAHAAGAEHGTPGRRAPGDRAARDQGATGEFRAARDRVAARERAAALFELVGISTDRLDSYAHQLSGGMRQRVCIALALALEPALVLLDEPTTALDVIAEREILVEIRRLQRELGFAVLFITHDLARMLQFSDRVAVFYAAEMVEVGPAAEMRRAPRHPYTQALLRTLPSVHSARVEVSSIPGAPPSLREPPAGCRFHPRCDRAVERCRTSVPELRGLAPGHSAACHLAE